VKGAYDRAMFMPPNTGANASFLGTVREALVHERLGPGGASVGVDLAFSTPRAWLAPGKRIDVKGAPTSFGDVSYTLVRRGAAIRARLVLPEGCRCRLRLRLPAGERVASATIDGAAVAVNSAGTIRLGARHGVVDVQATVG
jgi:hypothetical protein